VPAKLGMLIDVPRLTCEEADLLHSGDRGAEGGHAAGCAGQAPLHLQAAGSHMDRKRAL
jgi:hypothetical protein